MIKESSTEKEKLKILLCFQTLKQKRFRSAYKNAPNKLNSTINYYYIDMVCLWICFKINESVALVDLLNNVNGKLFPYSNDLYYDTQQDNQKCI